MTQLTQTQRRNPALALAGVAIAASMLGGIVGGVVGTRVQAIAEGAAAQQAQAAAAKQAKWDAYGAEWQRLNQAQQSRYLSTHDQAVLKTAQEWEARQRQMYPISTSTQYPDVLKAAQDWEARQRQMYPISN
jgi:hypothetical protein